ncbi:MAG: hypothetical protein GXO76_04840, partial [Calditrichaeota bacterium]|nr:hypothetical protein [Calditrichota bacterium]
MTLFHTTEKIPVAAADSTVRLKHSWIIKNSLSLRLKNHPALLPDLRRIDDQRGILYFKSPFKKADTLFAAYDFLPVTLPTTYFLWQPVSHSGGKKLAQSRRAVVRRKPRSQTLDTPRLRKSGSLTRSVTMGSNRGLRLDSGLNLQLSGQIAPNVQVVAALTDQNTPIQPEGNTQTLNEIDRVYIQVKSPYANATMGDFYLNYSGGRYENYRRKLQGAKVTLSRPGEEVTLSGAVSRGKFFTNRFNGQEGNQGPYQLHGDQGQTDIIVLAGTERVWVDGQPMTRGDDNDYVIEYGNGQITFTRHRLITADSRIEVDFEYSDVKFQRNLWSAQSDWQSESGVWKMNALLVREADDKNNPLDETYSKKDLAFLRTIGDARDSAFTSGAKFVGAGKGNFTRIDSAGVVFYRYLGEKQGDYQVRFSYTGPGGGDYRYLGAGRYVYVGKKLGSYLPVKLLTLPQSQNYGAFRLQFNPGKNFSFSGQLAASQFDPNTFSRIGDDQHFGPAYQVGLRWSPQSVKIRDFLLGSLQVRGNLREESSRFQPVSRIQAVEYNRKWDLQKSAGAGEKVQEMTLHFTRKKHLQLEGELGRLGKGRDFQADRWSGGIRITPQKGPRLFYRREWIASRVASRGQKSGWLRQKGQIQLPVWWLVPEVSYEGEDKRERIGGDSLRTGFRFNDWKTALSLKPLGRLQASVGLNWREDFDWSRQGYTADSRALTRFLKTSLRNWHNLTARLEWTSRLRDYTNPETQDRRTLLSDVSVLYTPFRRGIVSDVRYQISSTQLSKQERIYLKVDPGQGNYRFDEELNEYVPDPFGDYVLRTFSTGEFLPITDVQANWKFRFHPKRFLGRRKKREKTFKKWFRNFAWESYFRLNKKSTDPNEGLRTLVPGRSVFPQKNTIFGQYQIREDFFFFQMKDSQSLRLRWLENKEVNNRYTEGGQDNFRQEQSLRWIVRWMRNLGSEWNLYRKRIRKTYRFAGRQSRDIRALLGKGKVSYTWQHKVEFQLSGQLGRDRDRLENPATQAWYWELGTGVTLSLRGRGRVRSDFDWAEVRVSPGNRILPYEMAGGRAAGRNLNWNLGVDYRLSSRLMLLVSYTGRKDRIRPNV